MPICPFRWFFAALCRNFPLNRALRDILCRHRPSDDKNGKVLISPYKQILSRRYLRIFKATVAKYQKSFVKQKWKYLMRSTDNRCRGFYDVGFKGHNDYGHKNTPDWMSRIGGKQFSCVLLPYKITLLSNSRLCGVRSQSVLLPYKITLLSNQC